MRTRRFEWKEGGELAQEVRVWAFESLPRVDVTQIKRAFLEGESRDQSLRELTARFDATEVLPNDLTLAVDTGESADALSRIDAGLRSSLEVAATNIRAVAEAQMEAVALQVKLPQGHSVTIREVPVQAAGIYAPGGRAAYPSSVLMCAIPAQVAGVERLALATPPGPDGKVNPTVLAAAALCGIDEVYAIGGAQAVFALALGTETIPRTNVVAGPGNAWVRGAKADVSDVVAIDSLAGPSELMVIVDEQSNLSWAARDLCAQAEHGEETTLIAAATDDEVLDRLAVETEQAAASRSGVADAPLALLKVPHLDAAVVFSNVFAPEHIELLIADPAPIAARITTAGCIFVGAHSATAFGDYAAGSNHVLPTSGAGQFSGPLGPGIFRRKIATVEVPPEAAAKLAPHVDTIARAEGFPIHGESAMIRGRR
jgi:histidinol dehydrogenase